MAAAVLNPGTKQGKKTSNRGKLPSKRSINLVDVGVKPIKAYVAIPAVILIILAAALLSKFAVVDRLLAVSAAEQEVTRLRAELVSAYQTMESYGELTEEYAHYTFSGLTNEELNRVDRSQIVDLIQRVVLPQAEVGGWNVTDNRLILTITGSTLQEINLISQSLNEEELVDYCTVQTAATSDQYYGTVLADDAVVTAQIIVYLVKGVE